MVGSESKIEWECNNGGVLYASGDNTATGNIPSGFCASGYSSLRAAFIVSLLIDLVFQVCLMIDECLFDLGLTRLDTAVFVFPDLAVLEKVRTL